MKGICMTQPKTWTKRRKMKHQCFMTNGEDPRNERDVDGCWGCWAKECKLILEGYELNSAKFTPDGSKAWKFEQIFRLIF